MGLVFALATAVLWGSVAVIAARGMDRVSPGVASFVSNLAALVVFFPIVAAAGELHALLSDWRPWVYFGVAGIFSYVLGRTLYYVAMAEVGPSRATAVSAISILVAPLLAVLFLGEPLRPAVVVGVGLVAAGVFLVGRSL
jgi:drug/metabolite transporter (DMT)-like permease